MNSNTEIIKDHMEVAELSLHQNFASGNRHEIENDNETDNEDENDWYDEFDLTKSLKETREALQRKNQLKSELEQYQKDQEAISAFLTKKLDQNEKEVNALHHILSQKKRQEELTQREQQSTYLEETQCETNNNASSPVSSFLSSRDSLVVLKKQSESLTNELNELKGYEEKRQNYLKRKEFLLQKRDEQRKDFYLNKSLELDILSIMHTDKLKTEMEQEIQSQRNQLNKEKTDRMKRTKQKELDLNSSYIQTLSVKSKTCLDIMNRSSRLDQVLKEKKIMMDLVTETKGGGRLGSNNNTVNISAITNVGVTAGFNSKEKGQKLIAELSKQERQQQQVKCMAYEANIKRLKDKLQKLQERQEEQQQRKYEESSLNSSNNIGTITMQNKPKSRENENINTKKVSSMKLKAYLSKAQIQLKNERKNFHKLMNLYKDEILKEKYLESFLQECIKDNEESNGDENENYLSHHHDYNENSVKEGEENEDIVHHMESLESDEKKDHRKDKKVPLSVLSRQNRFLAKTKNWVLLRILFQEMQSYLKTETTDIISNG